MSDNYYHILQVPYKASQADIKAAYRTLAKEYHPDRNPGQEHIEDYFKSITQAYTTLSDPQKKSKYDWELYRKYGIRTGTDGHESHDSQQRVYTQYTPSGRTIYNHPNPFYSGTRYEYSKKTKRQGALFVVCFIIVVISFPLILEIASSERYYQKGLKYYQAGNYFGAVNNFDLALRDFGWRNTDACILATKIMIYQYDDYTYTFKYIERGLSYADEDYEFALLHYFKGLCLREQKKYRLAISHFQSAQEYKPGYDSAIYEMARVQAFFLNDYKEGLRSFNLLPEESERYNSSFFGKGFCHYHLQDYETAVHDFEHFIDFNHKEGYSYYLKGLSELKLHQDSVACQDFMRAWDLGVKEAKPALKQGCGISALPDHRKFGSVN